MVREEYFVSLRTKQMSVFESNVVETAFGTKHLEDHITADNTSEGTALLLHQDKLQKAPAMLLCCRIR
jgi:hypothetical protein